MILITGGNGYIGQNLSHYISSKAIWNEEEIPHIFKYDIKNARDILDRRILRDAISRCNQVYHLAAVSGVANCDRDMSNAWKTNVDGTMLVAEACNFFKIPLVFASSFAVTHIPQTFYGLTKEVAEKLVLLYGGTVCRLSNVYGGDYFLDLKDTVVARLIKGTFEERGHGEELRDFVDIGEVCKGLVDSMGKGGIREICSRKPFSINELVNLSKNPDFPKNIESYQRNL